MSNPEYIETRRRDGSVVRIIIPRTSADVINQPDIPGYALACLAFSATVGGQRRWSDFTRSTLERLESQFGSENFRRQLCTLLDDIKSGLRVTNPVGLLIHRVRLAATSDELGI